MTFAPPFQSNQFAEVVTRKVVTGEAFPVPTSDQKWKDRGRRKTSGRRRRRKVGKEKEKEKKKDMEKEKDMEKDKDGEKTLIWI
ncbi:hypothetical protein EYC80_008287 [Monilinia laxa]|uniref:Uncharacterized protein n=1 Tax=Monilinia laxa TaxID=61186 RepID=A0A5N6JU35_MONLA|nr:hypothetical protein EYC80_008287 [Monilinia laxa]